MDTQHQRHVSPGMNVSNFLRTRPATADFARQVTMSGTVTRRLIQRSMLSCRRQMSNGHRSRADGSPTILMSSEDVA
jgi:hypothetical protein